MILKKAIKNTGEYGSQIALIIIWIALSALSADFRSMNNIFSLLRQSAINGFIAFGMTSVILTGGIDLSVGSILALQAVLCAHLLKASFPSLLVILLIFASGVVLGILNALMVVKGKLQPFIATLVSMSAYRGLSLIFSGGRPISNLSNDVFFSAIGRGSVLAVPVPVIILFLVFLAFYFFLHKTVMGRHIYAVGSNSKAAALAGISVSKVQFTVYSLSALMSSVAALLIVSRLSSAQPTMGAGYELDAIAAVALGGTSMSGGRGKIMDTLTGVLIIASLNNGMNLLGVVSYYQQLVKAAVILFAVLADRKRK